MKVGDIVKVSKFGQSEGFCLVSGCGRYSCAVVVSMEPFVLISEEGDMLWIATIKPEYFETVGQASEKVMKVVNKRWDGDRKCMLRKDVK